VIPDWIKEKTAINGIFLDLVGWENHPPACSDMENLHGRQCLR
jgi:hypothetical protein